jgi:hypothetical protein
MLMLTGTLPRSPHLAEDVYEPITVLAIRFFDPQGPKNKQLAHVKQLARKMIRKRYPDIDVEKVCWDVYEPRLTVGGLPHWLGPAVYYE